MTPAKRLWVSAPSVKALAYRSKDNVYLFMPINGVGLGHLTRCLAIARRLRKKDPSAKIVFLTTSIALPIVHREGFVCHHVPPVALCGENITQFVWNRLYTKSIEMVIGLYCPSVIVFDGAFPYLGLRRIILQYSGKIRSVWIKRGLYRDEAIDIRLDAYLNDFDAIIVPSEISKATTNADYPTVSHRSEVNPIYLLDKTELMPRKDALKALGLHPHDACAYVQLGAGNINDVESVQKRVIHLLRTKGYKVVVARSPIAMDAENVPASDRVIMDYPNCRFYRAFDLAVMAGGYNSVCEAVVYGLPTIFIPNLNTLSDDQVSRVEKASKMSCCVSLYEFEEKVFNDRLDELLAKKALGKCSFEVDFVNGACQVSDILENMS